jgi:hypothetical protein
VNVDAQMAFEALLRKTAQKIWREVTDGDDESKSDGPDDLFKIGGVSIKEELRFRDDEVPGNHRTVAREFSTVSQLFGQAEVTSEKAAQTVEKAKEQLRAANTALQRADGRAQELLINVKDE